MQRRDFLSQTLGAIGALGLAPVLSQSSSEANASALKPARQPNILIILNDDQGWGDLGCAGHPYLQTPGMDRLAHEGCRLTNFYVSSPVCSPSRAGLITGRIQNRFGMQHLINAGGNPIPLFHHIPADEPTLPRQLKAAGYRTAHIGKWHISFFNRPGDPGVAAYGYDHHLILAADRHVSYFDSKWTRNGERLQTTDAWSAPMYVDEAIRFIEQPSDQPFFINMWTFAPHQEVECAPEFQELYKHRPEAEQNYMGCLSQMDREIGRMLDYLERTGLAENTIVIFTSDNGPEPHLIPWSHNARGSTGGLRGGKHHLYEGGIRVPAIIRWPGFTQAGSVSHEPMCTQDLLPTLCAAAGATVPTDKPTDGSDLRPGLQGEAIERKQPMYWQFPFVGVGLRNGTKATSPPLAMREKEWKLLCNEDFSGVELYNLAIDPNEQWNMAQEESERTATLLERIKAIHADVNGPYSREAKFINPQMKADKPG